MESILKEEGYHIMAQAGDGVKTLALARQFQPGLIVLEIAMPGLDGIDVIQRIKRLGFRTDVLVLTTYPAGYGAQRCLKAGAAGFLSKTNQLDDLRNALRTLRSGFIFFPKLPLDQDGPALTDLTESQRIARLSARELSVLRYLAVGFSNVEIGEALLLSSKTISAYKSRLINKLKVKSVVCLADLARRHHLL